jgi:hypothetical protein
MILLKFLENEYHFLSFIIIEHKNNFWHIFENAQSYVIVYVILLLPSSIINLSIAGNKYFYVRSPPIIFAI